VVAEKRRRFLLAAAALAGCSTERVWAGTMDHTVYLWVVPPR
jgi:hypothetical protein